MNLKEKVKEYGKIYLTFVLAIIIRLLNPVKPGFAVDVMECVAAFTLLILMVWGTEKKIFTKEKHRKLELLCFGVFSVFSTLSYIYGRSLSLHDMNVYMGIYCMASLTINFALAQYGYQFIKGLFKRNYPKPIKCKFIAKNIQRNNFLFYFIFLMIPYLFFLILNYPGVLMFDPEIQILQIYKIPNMTTSQVNLIDPNQYITTHHPFIHTMLIKLFLMIGEAIGSLDAGIFIYSLFQITVMAAAIAYLLQYVRKYFTDRGMLNWLILFAFNPIVLMYSELMTKDTIFAVLFALFGIKFYEYIKDNAVLHDKKWVISFLIITLLCSFFRNNFFYIAVLTFVALLIVKREKVLLKIVAVYLCIFFAYSSILIPALGVTKGSIREMISVPFQQTANYAKYYDVTDAEKEIIEKILDFETVEEYENPEVSNRVKNTYNKHATNEDLLEYFKVWIKMFFKHPLAYFDAYFNQFYGYFSTKPYFSASYCLSPNLDARADLIKMGIDLEETMPFMTAKRIYDSALILLSSATPVLYLITNSGIYIWIIMAAIAALLKKGNKKMIWFYMPFILYFLTLLLSPANASIEYRYMFPYLIALPILLIPAREIIKSKIHNEDT